jgi:hypothetical protein
MNRSKFLLATIAAIGIFMAPLFAAVAAAPTDDLSTAIQKGLLNAVSKEALAELENFTVEQAGWINKSGQFEGVEFEPSAEPPGPGSEPPNHWMPEWNR